MADGHSLRTLLHRATHRIPGVPIHTGQPAGHQAQTRHDHARSHSPARRPRVMVAWQRRIARFFGQEL